MAVVSHPADYAGPSVKVGPKVARVLFYLVVGAVAAGAAITAALATGEVGLFEECYSSCAALAQ